jgi:hypothetical protein
VRERPTGDSGAERREPPFSSLTTYISVPESVRDGAGDAVARSIAKGAVYYSGVGAESEDPYA